MIKNYLLGKQAGICALLEFLLAAVLQLEHVHLLALPHHSGLTVLMLGFVELVLVVLFMVHTIVVISQRVWDPWFSVLYVLLMYFIAQILASALVSIYPALKGWSATASNTWLNNAVVAQFFYVLFAEALTLAAIWGYLKIFRIKLSKIGLRKPHWRDPLYGLSAVPVYYLLYYVAVLVIGHVVNLNVNQQQNIGFTSVHGLAQMVLTFVSLVILPPLTEEIMVRGLLYSSLKKGLPQLAAVVVTSGIFASAHLPEGSGGLLWIAAVDTFTLSLILIYLREKTGGLWASMTLHAFKNGVAFVALFILATR
jgi:membrane protease YdiL (CAAX protease family)